MTVLDDENGLRSAESRTGIADDFEVLALDGTGR